MPRGVKKARVSTSPTRQADAYPEHAKLYPHMNTNWEIRAFMDFLTRKGVCLLSWQQVNSLLLEFRGVDQLAYSAETADMKVKYRWLWEQYGVEPDEPVMDDLAGLVRQVAQVQGDVAVQDVIVPDVDAVAFLFSKMGKDGPV